MSFRRVGNTSVAASGLTVAMILAAGCHGHVQLHAPSTSAPAPARVAAYKKLRPTMTHETTTVAITGNAIWANRTTDYVQLAGGDRVYHPEDLLPVVKDGSPTSRAVDEYDGHVSDSNIAGIITGLAFIASVAVITMGVMDDSTGMLIGGGLLAGGATGTAIWSMVAHGHAQDAKMTAFQTLDGSLRARLDLCGSGEAVSPCEGGYYGPAAPVDEHDAAMRDAGAASTSAAATATGPTRAAASAARVKHVKRIKNEETGRHRIVAQIGGATLAFEFVGEPAIDAGAARVRMRIKSDEDAHRECTVKLVADGERVALTAGDYKHEDGYEFLPFSIGFDAVGQVSEASRVLGRVCDDEFQINESQREVLREFLVRVKEELAWQD